MEVLRSIPLHQEATKDLGSEMSISVALEIVAQFRKFSFVIVIPHLICVFNSRRSGPLDQSENAFSDMQNRIDDEDEFCECKIAVGNQRTVFASSALYL